LSHKQDRGIPPAHVDVGDAVANRTAMNVPSALVAAGMTDLARWG
jgi:hypothetical protein